ncbi:diacylglycerol/polyprenol kinase family protein [Gloeothece verrucosa]|uniref:Phosphatidate cytidylyltransferase n=1 Tax=Gloeothece verrucosa (strain PCC 7822) TaxID=497965 RepID=E0UKD7_GLOV7|nr:diacylglycerol/polyprenol kinase family protein [Gloeothece verrucosa]ADN17018.1 phosphatidate cytidylyltransferase [Gloeothece verrucosa PCC 7822]
MSDSLFWLKSWFPVSLWFPLSVVSLFLLSILLLAEGLSRFTSMSGELTRKVVHIGTGNVILLAWWLNIPPILGISAAVIAGCIALISFFLPILPSINSVGRRSLGTFFYALSIGILIAWFWPLGQPQYAVIGILVMTWGDGMAAVIGQQFGKHPYQIWGNNKSWEGSLAMMLMSFLVTSWVLLTTVDNHGLVWLTGLLVAIMATSLETISKLGIDNLTVPLASAFLAYLMINF